MAARLVLLNMLALARNVYTMTEQPGSSLFKKFPYLLYLIGLLKGWMDFFIRWLSLLQLNETRCSFVALSLSQCMVLLVALE